MNLEDYRKRIYSYRSESNLYSELCLLDAIQSHQEERYLQDSQKEEFWKLVSWIDKSKPGLNDIPEDEIGRRFHVRKYEKKSILKDLAFYEVGKIYGKRSDGAKIDDFAFFSEHMEHGFYLSYEVGRQTLSDIVDGFDGRNEDFLNHCRSMNDRREDFVAYCKRVLDDQKSDEELIAMMNPYNAGDYVELPLGVYELSSFLIRDSYYDLYAKLLAKLYYFPLQGALMSLLHRAEDGFAVWEELEKQNLPRIKTVEYLLRDRILKLLGDEPEMLERNSQNEYISEKDRQVGKELLDGWNKRADGLACYLVDLSIKRFGDGETSEWYAKHQAQLAGREPKFVKYALQSLAGVERCLEPRLNLTVEELDGKDLNTLLYYAKVSSCADKLDKSFYTALVEKICHHAYNDRYVQALKLDDQSFQTMRNVYRCILKGDVDGIKMMAAIRQSALGYQSDYSSDFRKAMGDSVWLPILMLMTEETENKEYFRQVMSILTAVANYDKASFNDNYYVSYYLAELLVLQVLKDEKDAFERYLIGRVCNLQLVLRILLANNGQMSDENKELLRKRVDAEWEYEKMLSKQYREQVDVLDGYLKKVFG